MIHNLSANHTKATMMRFLLHPVLVVLLLLQTQKGLASKMKMESSAERKLRHFRRCYSGIDPVGMVIVQSTRSFEATYNELISRLNANPAIFIASEFDHAANAARVGLSLAPTRLVVFGNPQLGTPIMQQNRLAGLDLPQKMLVWQEGGAVYVGYNNPAYFVARYGRRLQRGASEQLATVAMALRGLAAGAAGVAPESVNVPSSGVGRRFWSGLQVSYSRNDFETTWGRLMDAIDASPADIAFTVDHASNAENIGLSLGGQSRLVVFGNPNVGTPFMVSSQSAGIDLPLKILVTQDDWGHVLVTTNQIGFLNFRHGTCEVDPTMAQTAVMNFMNAATGR